MNSKSVSLQPQEGSVTFKTGTFAFSATNINDLESSEYTLCVICVDTSYSISDFVNELKTALQNAIVSCQSSPRSDNLLIRIVTFDRNVEEFHGFKELNKCTISDYDNVFSNLGDRTSLYDACVNGIESVSKYGQELCSNDYSVNGLTIFITDGQDNFSSETPNTIKTKLAEAVGENKLESLVSILVGVNTADAGIGTLLKNFASSANLTEYIDISKATSKEFAKLGQFISKSITSQSKNLGTGVPAQSLSF